MSALRVDTGATPASAGATCNTFVDLLWECAGLTILLHRR